MAFLGYFPDGIKQPQSCDSVKTIENKSVIRISRNKMADPVRSGSQSYAGEELGASRQADEALFAMNEVFLQNSGEGWQVGV